MRGIEILHSRRPDMKQNRIPERVALAVGIRNSRIAPDWRRAAHFPDAIEIRGAAVPRCAAGYCAQRRIDAAGRGDSVRRIDTPPELPS
jgi:hypothetical protein